MRSSGNLFKCGCGCVDDELALALKLVFLLLQRGLENMFSPGSEAQPKAGSSYEGSSAKPEVSVLVVGPSHIASA